MVVVPLAVAIVLGVLLVGEFANADVYQVLAYCRALGVRAAVLLYPEWRGQPRRFRVCDGENEVRLDGISIAGGARDIEESLAAWVGRARTLLVLR